MTHATLAGVQIEVKDFAAKRSNVLFCKRKTAETAQFGPVRAIGSA
ncbi:hypothetical protein MPC1_2720006 [Methylocella tundrae]|nr:hypothetical protein MPC1_2720006 [Methylocella tundrae]